jgi:hypothetical protein
MVFESNNLMRYIMKKIVLAILMFTCTHYTYANCFVPWEDLLEIGKKVTISTNYEDFKRLATPKDAEYLQMYVTDTIGECILDWSIYVTNMASGSSIPIITVSQFIKLHKNMWKFYRSNVLNMGEWASFTTFMTDDSMWKGQSGYKSVTGVNRLFQTNFASIFGEDGAYIFVTPDRSRNGGKIGSGYAVNLIGLTKKQCEQAWDDFNKMAVMRGVFFQIVINGDGYGKFACKGSKGDGIISFIKNINVFNQMPGLNVVSLKGDGIERH